jgi:transposase
MIATTRSTESSAPGATLKLAFELGSTKWTLGCGREGFWLRRWLSARGIENVVVQSSSIEVTQRARRAKTDRLDVGKVLALLVRWHGLERKVWRVVDVPSAESEAQRQLTREIDTVRRKMESGSAIESRGSWRPRAFDSY